MSWFSTRRPALLLTAIVLFAGWLRLPGDFYPAALHFDEGQYIENVLCNFPPVGTFYHPFLSRYLLTIAEAPPCVKAWRQGSGHPVRATAAAFVSDPAPFLTLGRNVSLLCGLATVALTFVLGRRLGGVNVGLAAALLVAISPGDVILSNNLGPWALATLLTIPVFLLIIRISGTSANRWWLLALGMAVGLAMAVVYTMGLLFVPVALALAARWRERRLAGESTGWLRDIAAIAAGAVIAQGLGNFTALLNPGHVWHDFTVPESSLLGDQNAHPTYLKNLLWYLGSLFDHLGLGLAVASLGLAGLVIAAVRRESIVWWAMLAYIAALLLLQPLALVLMANRYTGPLTPLLAVGAAWLMVEAGRGVARIPGLARLQPTLLLLALALLPGLSTDLAYRHALALPPTRELARRWIEANIPGHSAVIQSIAFMGPAVLDCGLMAQQPSIELTRPCYDLRLAPVDPEHYTSKFLDYTANSDATYLLYTATTPPGTLRRLGKSLSIGPALRARYRLLARFQYPGLDGFQDDTATLNPAVEIYQLAR